jgi:hypothetical protein
MKKQPTTEDFARVNAAALARASELVPQLLPGGRRFGDLYIVDEVHDRPGFGAWVHIPSGNWQIFRHLKPKPP